MNRPRFTVHAQGWVYPYFAQGNFSAGKKVLISGVEGLHILELEQPLEDLIGDGNTPQTPPTVGPTSVIANQTEAPSLAPTTAAPTSSPTSAPTYGCPAECNAMVTTWMSPIASENNTFQAAETTWNLIGDRDGQSPFAPGNDDTDKRVTLPFPITWYCTQFSEMWINVNGWISFGPDEPTWSYSPDDDAPNTLAVMWIDLYIPTDSGQIKASAVGGTDPHVVVSWEGLRTFSDRSNVDAATYTFQVRCQLPLAFAIASLLEVPLKSCSHLWRTDEPYNICS